MSEPVTIRTATRRVSNLQEGDRIMLLKLREARVVTLFTEPAGENPIRMIDRGVNNPPEPVHWVVVWVVWEDAPDSPAFFLRLEGDRIISVRDSR